MKVYEIDITISGTMYVVANNKMEADECAHAYLHDEMMNFDTDLYINELDRKLNPQVNRWGESVPYMSQELQDSHLLTGNETVNELLGTLYD